MFGWLKHELAGPLLALGLGVVVIYSGTLWVSQRATIAAERKHNEQLSGQLFASQTNQATCQANLASLETKIAENNAKLVELEAESKAATERAEALMRAATKDISAKVTAAQRPAPEGVDLCAYADARIQESIQ